MDVLALADGLWAWSARHREWFEGAGWPPEVWCFYVETPEATLLVDPLVPEDEAERFWRALDRDVERRGAEVAVLLTQAAHARDAAEVAARYGGGVWGHEDARGKVGAADFHALGPEGAAPGGARVAPLDQEPGGSGTPLYLPSHRALAAGDALIAIGGELRVWWLHGASEEGWYRERLLPSLRAWLELPLERLLVAHGEPPAHAPADLAEALERAPHTIV